AKNAIQPRFNANRKHEITNRQFFHHSIIPSGLQPWWILVLCDRIVCVLGEENEMARVAGEKSLSQAIKERRATQSLGEVPIQAADLEKIIRAGLEAPSGYNLQPWRFIVVRDGVQKKKLMEAAFGQAKIAEASAVIVALGDPEGWKNGDLEEMLTLAAEH